MQSWLVWVGLQPVKKEAHCPLPVFRPHQEFMALQVGRDQMGVGRHCLLV